MDLFRASKISVSVNHGQKLPVPFGPKTNTTKGVTNLSIMQIVVYGFASNKTADVARQHMFLAEERPTSG